MVFDCCTWQNSPDPPRGNMCWNKTRHRTRLLRTNFHASHGRKYFRKPFKETTSFFHINIVWCTNCVPHDVTSTFSIGRFTLRINLHLSYFILYQWTFVHLLMKVEHWQNILWGGESAFAPRKQTGFNEANTFIAPCI